MDEVLGKIKFSALGPGLREDCPYKDKCAVGMAAPNFTEKLMIKQSCVICTLLQEILKQLRAG